MKTYYATFMYRDNDGQLTTLARDVIKNNIYEILIILNRYFVFDDMAAENINKLLDRKRRGKIKGDGDVR